MLGIAITECADGQGKSVRTLRFPFRELGVYLSKLVRADKRVALCERVKLVRSNEPDNH